VAGPSSCDLHPADAHTASRFRQLVVHSTLEFSTAALPVFRSERFGLGGDCGRNGTAEESFVASDNDRTRMNPGDDAPPGTPGTGEDVCPVCRGTGRISNSPCENCGGTGKVIEGIGGA